LLNAVTEILRERKLLEPGDEPGYNITLIGEHRINIAAFARSGAFFHVKVKECGHSPSEYSNYCNASRSFPKYVPEILGHDFRNAREVIVIRGIPHRHVPHGDLAADRHGLVREVISFVAASSAGARIATPVEPHQAFLRQVEACAADPVCAAIAREWIASRHLDGLPHIQQHGDFVMNNLGATRAGLVVFDWEDFGRVALPGLDLCTLVASDTGFSADQLRAIMRGDNRLAPAYAELIDRSCPLIGLTPQLFRQLIPLYLVIFLDLKRRYGKAIGQVVGKLIHDMGTLG
jgi:hypothetical protein